MSTPWILLLVAAWQQAGDLAQPPFRFAPQPGEGPARLSLDDSTPPLAPPAAGDARLAPPAGNYQYQPAALPPPGGTPTYAEPPAGNFSPSGLPLPAGNPVGANRFQPAAGSAPTPAAPRGAAGLSDGVQPASNQQPLSPRAGRGEQRTLVETLLEQSLTPPQRNALAGHRLALAEALARSSDPTRRLAVSKHYWFVAYLVAEYHAALEEYEIWNELPRPQQPYDQNVLAAAKSAALARAQEAELNAVAAQYELADLAMIPVVDALPLPADRPLVGAYGTKFDALFAGRTPPLSLRRIDRTLPLRHKLVVARAESTTAAANVLSAEMQGYRNGQTSLSNLVAAQTALRENRGAFLMAVRQYNFDIAEYVAAVASPGTATETYVSMLIGSRTASTARSVLVNGAGGVRQTSATSPVEPVGGLAPQSNFQSLPPGGLPLQELSDLPPANDPRFNPAEYQLNGGR